VISDALRPASDTPESPSARWALIDALLPETVAHAREFVPLYDELYRDLPPVRCRRDLEFLPTVDRALLGRSGSRALASDRRTDFIGNTSGTTGRCLLVHGCSEEEKFVHDFFTAFAATHPSVTPTLVFSLSIPTHGASRAIPVNCFHIPSCALDDGTARNFSQYLKEGGEALGFTGGHRVISAFLDQFLLFTSYCLRSGVSPRDFNINLISVTGDYISRRLRSLLQEHWNATILERYSLSEIFGGASQRAYKSGFDFDRYVVPELIERDEKNTGELVLTTLYPFVQRQPMIRYRTGDVFTAEDDLFIYRGRKTHCLQDPDSQEFLLYGTDLYDLFDEYPTIARQERSLDYASHDVLATGKPIVSGRWNSNGPRRSAVRLTVALTFDPAFYPKIVRGLRDEMIHKVETSSDGRVSPSIEFVFGRHAVSDSQFKKSGFLWHYE
jgi:hypothetical protein